jgi:hypothetical protein
LMESQDSSDIEAATAESIYDIIDRELDVI